MLKTKEIIELIGSLWDIAPILVKHIPYSESEIKDACNFAVKAIDALSTNREKGEWIPMYDRWGDIATTVCGYECSKCGEWNADNDKFCPNCGADMRGGKE